MRIVNLLRRLRRAPEASTTPTRARYYHAVAIVPKTSSCEEARSVAGVRYLSREAPPLPLPTCPQPERCRCRFEKFDDRRQDDDRRDIASSGRWYAGEEKRRQPRGRRITDQ
jgi:hypothetical protein